MEPLHVAVLGRFQVRCQCHLLAGFEPAKVQELLTYLLLFCDRPVSRESLAAQLWDEDQPGRGKSYLRKAVWQLQKSLTEELGLRAEEVLLVEPEWIQLQSSPYIDADSLQLERAFASVRDLPAHRLNKGQRQEVLQAVECYRGDLLEGCYMDWCLIERQRLQIIFLALLDKLINYCICHGDYEAGISYGYQILRHDRARERTHRQLMRLHHLSGNRTDALRQYALCCEILAEELNVLPSLRTRQLYEGVRDGAFHPSAAGEQLAVTGVSELLATLPQFEEFLSDARRVLERLAALPRIDR
jgi:DNA-binding SARP family transcriptional activator